MLSCSLYSMRLEIKSLHNDTMYVIEANHSSLKRYGAKLVVVTFAFGGTVYLVREHILSGHGFHSIT